MPALGGVAYGRAMVTARYRFIEWTGQDKDKVVRELYDHQTDPAEDVNVAGKAENKELVEALSKQLAAGWKAASE